MSTIEPLEWSRPLGDGPVSLTDPQLSELMHHLMMIGSELYKARGHRMSSSGAALEFSSSRYSLTGPDPADLPAVLVLKEGTAVRFMAVAPVAPDDVSASAWDDVFVQALQRVGRSAAEFEWTAVIGVLPDSEVAGPALGEPATVGELALHPCGDPYFEYDNSEPFAHGKLGVGGQVAHSWPVVVSGIATGYKWQGSADADAATQLASLCGLLTLAFDVLWSVRDSPVTRGTIDRLNPEWRVPPGPAQSNHFTDNLVPRRTDYHVPIWMIDVWPSLTGRVLEAVEMHREGVSLTSAHPSFALIAYVSSIESVAVVSKKASRCAECKQVTESGARFRESIASVLDDEQAEILSKAYNRRSRTAHSSKLYGEEQERGVHVFKGPFGPDDQVTFRWVILRLARQASRLLLLQSLGASI